MLSAFPSTHSQFELYSSNNSKSSLWTCINTPLPFSESDLKVCHFFRVKMAICPSLLFFYHTYSVPFAYAFWSQVLHLFFSTFLSFFSIWFFCVCLWKRCMLEHLCEIYSSSRISIWNIVGKLSCKNLKYWEGLKMDFTFFSSSYWEVAAKKILDFSLIKISPRIKHFSPASRNHGSPEVKWNYV